jgi:hypothetical protein
MNPGETPDLRLESRDLPDLGNLTESKEEYRSDNRSTETFVVLPVGNSRYIITRLKLLATQLYLTYGPVV